jgi:hypothetical protein
MADYENEPKAAAPRRRRDRDFYISGFTAQRVLLLLLLVGVLVAVGIGDSWLAAHAAARPANHYPRPNIMVIQTRRNGAWTARCHSVHVLKNGTDTIYAAGGCLPPRHTG